VKTTREEVSVFALIQVEKLRIGASVSVIAVLSSSVVKTTRGGASVFALIQVEKPRIGRV
jgi:hypothetical protein